MARIETTYSAAAPPHRALDDARLLAELLEKPKGN